MNCGTAFTFDPRPHPFNDVLPFSHNLYVFRTSPASIKIYDAHAAFAIATLRMWSLSLPTILLY